ncbi:MAG: hypothetical protein ACK5QC_07645 [Bacteroidota bacterium]
MNNNVLLKVLVLLVFCNIAVGSGLQNRREHPPRVGQSQVLGEQVEGIMSLLLKRNVIHKTQMADYIFQAKRLIKQ